MDNLDLLNNDLQVTPQGQSYLAEAAKWGKFLSIMGFILCGLMVIVAFFVPAYLSQMSEYSGMSSAMSSGMRAGMTVLYLLMALLFFFPCLYLYKFSTKMQVATKTVSQENFDESLMNLKSMFKFYAILTIIILSFYALVFIVTIIGAAMR
jgi:uncharacterized membrane protein YjgN (DUF898 family)